VMPLSGLFDLVHAEEIDFLKVDIEGSEHDVFAAANPDLLGRFKRLAMEYHDQIVPGTLDLLRRVLSPTHEITVRPSKMEGCGILLARRRDLGKYPNA
jgi:methyltransferase FkbM-like protein